MSWCPDDTYVRVASLKIPHCTVLTPPLWDSTSVCDKISGGEQHRPVIQNYNNSRIRHVRNHCGVICQQQSTSPVTWPHVATIKC